MEAREILEMADVGTIKSTPSKTNHDITILEFQVNGIGVHCYYSADIEGLYGFHIRNGEDFVKLVGGYDA